MISKSFMVMGVLTLLSAAAHAGSAPKELYGKSITLQWSEPWTGKVADQPTTPRNWGRAISLNIYISTAGHAFMREFGSTTGGFNPHGITNNYAQSTSSSAPGESKDHFDFQGRSVVVYRQFRSGARRISIDFDDSRTNCKAAVINGKEGGQNILRGDRAEMSSVEVGAVSCSIRAGNVFGQ